MAQLRDRDEILSAFEYRKFTRVQQFQAQGVVGRALVVLAFEILKHVPDGDSKDLALQKLLEVKMMAQHAIGHDWKLE